MEEDEDVLDHEGVRQLLKCPTVGSVHYMRRRGIIPHNRLHYRGIVYSKKAVLAAIARRELKASRSGCR